MRNLKQFATGKIPAKDKDDWKSDETTQTKDKDKKEKGKKDAKTKES